jgi:tetratricopeptide (TPR) repeat protein
MAAAGLEPASPSLAETATCRAPMTVCPLLELPSADAQPVLPPVTTVSGSDEAPVQSTPRETDAVSRAVEPGPLQKPNTGGKTRSLTPRHPPSPAQLAPRPQPGASKPTGGRNPDAAVRKTVPSDGDDDLFYKKARAYHRSNRLDDAIGLYRRVLNTHSSHPGATLNLAAAYMQQGNFVAAHPLLKRLERSSPRPQGVLLNLAIACNRHGRP